MNLKKIIITHGIYRYTSFNGPQIYIRNSMKTFFIPTKFKELLLKKYLQWWYLKTSIIRFKKRIPIGCLVDNPIEFTIAENPYYKIMVISIVHPLDTFKRRTGVKIVKERLEWAIHHPYNKRIWKCETNET